MTAEMNRLIRRSAGRLDPMEVADRVIAERAAEGEDKDLRERIAERAGLPPGLADRLKGTDAAELADDAKVLADTLAEIRPTPHPPEDFNTQIRRAAGRLPDGEERTTE